MSYYREKFCWENKCEAQPKIIIYWQLFEAIALCKGQETPKSYIIIDGDI